MKKQRSENAYNMGPLKKKSWHALHPLQLPLAKSLYTHVAVNMLYLAVYLHTSIGFIDIFLRNTLECFPSCFLSLHASIDTEDVVHLLRLCFVSCDPIGICFSSQCRVSRSINGCSTTSWKQLQKAQRIFFFYPPCIFKRFFPHPSTLVKALLQSQEHV